MTGSAKALVVGLVATAFAGCGGDDESSGGMSKEEYLAKADAICARANPKEEAIVREGPGWHYGPKFSDPKLMTQFTAVGRGVLRELRALEPPREQRQAVDEALEHLDTALGAIEREIAAVRAGDDDLSAKHSKIYETAYGDMGAAAARAGFTQCQGVGF